jgi:galactose mutarotase-like enzyme
MLDGKQGLWRDAKGKEWQVPMHGFARNMPFEITTLNGGPQCSEATIGMRLTSNEKTLPGYPFQFIFDARYTLRDNALEVAVTATNTGNIPLPYYTGHHFYFALPSVERGQWRLELPAEQWGRQREDGSIAREDAPLKGDESVFSISDETLRDRFHLGGDFGGIVKLYRPGTVPDAAGAGGRSGTYIVLDLRPRDKELPWYCVTTWTQAADSDYYCVEPWLGLPNAIHHGEGLRWLAPGKTEKAVVRLSAW